MHPNDGRVVSNFIVQALLGRPITIYGDGRQSRSFCYVNDLVDAIVRLMATDDAVTGPINIGNPAEFTIGEFGFNDNRAHRLEIRRGEPAAPRRRSAPAPTGHRNGAQAIGLGPTNTAQRRPSTYHRIF